MKIVALYKCWSGQEWLQPSIASIYPYVEAIVILTSGVSWIGARDNPSIPEIERIMKECDPDKKIHHVQHDEPNQLVHCEVGYEYIKQAFKDIDWVQLIDSDEVWDRHNIEKAMGWLESNRNTPGNAIRVRTYTYVKSPFYRVEPPEAIEPVCWIRANLPNMGMEPRGCAINPRVTIPDVWMHHFAWVRYHVNEVMVKIIQSHTSEKQPMHDIPYWIVEKWNKLPHAHDFHIAVGFAHHYKSIKQIGREDLPEVLRGGVPIIIQFDKGK